jgi:hypothetical protein
MIRLLCYKNLFLFCITRVFQTHQTQDLLLTNSNVVEAEANWKGQGGEVLVLDHSHFQSMSTTTAQQSYQNGGIVGNNSNGSSIGRRVSEFENIL